jgi:DNA-binding response OmpR family regulator
METKSNELRKAIPVIVATEIDDRAKGFALGADAYFVKPVLRDELIAELMRLTMHAAAPSSGRISSGTHSYET